ncbi:hypothetical protein Bca4012_090959 [Brassica carinata]
MPPRCVSKALFGSESRWKVATLEMQMNVNQGKLKSENRNMIFKSLLLEIDNLLKPDLCGMNSNAPKEEWIETHKCIIGEHQEEIQSTKVQKIAMKRFNTERQQLTKQSVPPSFWRKYLSSDQSSDYSNYF